MVSVNKECQNREGCNDSDEHTTGVKVNILTFVIKGEERHHTGVG